jgi:membrane fusion protein, heavy metal efflux system
MTSTERWRRIWMGAAAAATLIVIVFIVKPPAHVAPKARDTSEALEVARIVGPRLVAITPGSALERKLGREVIRSQSVRFPQLTVTASVAAHFGTRGEHTQDRWQFQSPEVSSAYADWRKAQNDSEYAGKQLAKTRELGRAQIARFGEIYERMKKLVETGTETPKDLAIAKADLVQAELQSQKDEFDAESTLNIALRTRAAAERVLAQAGLDPAALETTAEVAIVVAQVPEAKMTLAREGEPCDAHFYAIPDATFPGRVARIAPTLSPERRTLRVLFELPDPSNRLKPGMFADVGLGTMEREALLVPAEALLHVGRGDFVLIRSEQSPWRVQDVEVGEDHGDLVELLQGVAAGQEVVARGAVLLKPLVVQALEQ